MKTITFNPDKIGAKLLKFSDGNEYICIPYKASYMDKFTRKDGTVGLTINLSENDLKEPKKSEYNDQFEDCGFIKANLKKEAFEKLTKEQKDSIPICGNVSRYLKSVPESTIVSESFGESTNDDDLPF